jgi:hypothetical protein
MIISIGINPNNAERMEFVAGLNPLLVNPLNP